MSTGPQVVTHAELEAELRKLRMAIRGASITSLPAEEGGGEGAETFLELNDTPDDYSAYSGYLPAVNAAEDALEWNPYVTLSATTPTLTIGNVTDSAIDPVIKLAAGATPAVLYTMGVDINDDGKWKLAHSGALGDNYDIITAKCWDGITASGAEFSLADTWQTPIGGGGTTDDPRGIATDLVYLYYSDYQHDQLVKIDLATETEVLRVSGPGQSARMVSDGTYLYVIGRQVDKVYKYACADLSYVAISAWLQNGCGMCYWGGHLYVTDISTGASGRVLKIRCSDMSTIWAVGFSQGSGDNQFDKAVGIATDGVYLYVLDCSAAPDSGSNNRIVRLNISDGSWVDHVDMGNTVDSYAIWLAGDWVYIGTHDGYIDKLLRLDLSLVERFPVLATDVRQAIRVGDYHYLASIDDTCIYKYTYVAPGSYTSQGIFFRLRDVYGQMVDIARVAPEGRFGVMTMFPDETITAIGNIKATGGQFISTKAVGTKPISVVSTTVCTNLNADLLDGHHSTDFLLAGGAIALADLTDVSFPSNEPTVGDVLTYESGVWTSMPPSAGAAAFLDLTDVDEADYIGHTGEFVVVNAGEDGLEFSASSVAAHDLDYHSDVSFPSGEPTVGDVLTYQSGGWTSMPPSGGASALDDLTDVDAAAPSNGDTIVYNDGTGQWEAAAPGVGALALDDLSDVDAAAPNAGDVLTYESGQWVASAAAGGGAPTNAKYIVQEANGSLSNEQSLGALTTGLLLNTVAAGVGVLSKATAGTDYAAPCNHLDLHIGSETADDGYDQDRTTGSSYVSQSATITVPSPIQVTLIKWDFKGAATYTLTINGVQFGDAYVAAGDTEDAEFSGSLVLMGGTHTIKVTRNAGGTWYDKNTGSFTGTLWSSVGITYVTSYFSSYSIPMKMTANALTWATCGS